ncbi:MAG: hypothetical protein J0H67_21775 [Rhodospirillales bacterium]|nr:hypothetical protein [Rhodospirillales bacterium]
MIAFKRLVRSGLAPQRATRDAAGILPVRAVRHCEPVTSASAFGWYVFPPIDFSIVFDGADFLWTYENAGSWFPLRTAQYPGFSSEFDALAPPESKGFAPPFLAVTEDPGILQIWTGLIVSTAPGWSVLLRAPANVPRSPGYEQLEGIIETDRWFGPLFTNIRVNRPDIPINFVPHRPFLQVQPLRREYYDEDFLKLMRVDEGLSALTPAEWGLYYDSIVRPNLNPNRKLGEYAVAARKRRALERQNDDE